MFSNYLLLHSVPWSKQRTPKDITFTAVLPICEIYMAVKVM